MGFREDAVTAMSIRREPFDALRRLHRYNAVFLAGFILLHLATHLSGF